MSSPIPYRATRRSSPATRRRIAEEREWRMANSVRKLLFAIPYSLFAISIRQHRIRRRRAVGDLQPEQAADQFDRDPRGTAALVEERIELDDIERMHQSGIMQ